MMITQVIPNKDFTLFVKSKDNRHGIFDVAPYLDSEVFSPLKEEKNFRKLTNGGYYVEWECGADLSADTIEAHWIVNAPSSNTVLHKTARRKNQMQ